MPVPASLQERTSWVQRTAMHEAIEVFTDASAALQS